MRKEETIEVSLKEAKLLNKVLTEGMPRDERTRMVLARLSNRFESLINPLTN